MNFIEIVDRIFINKNKYNEISDDDKIASFFIINRKFAKEFPNIAEQFNYKNMDKASAIDMWFEHFKNINKIPQWYWDPKNRIKKSKFKKGDYNSVKIREDLKDYDIDYLEKYYEEDLKLELKKINELPL